MSGPKPTRLLVAALALAGLSLLAAFPATAQYGAIEGNFGKNKIQYREFKWSIYHSPHFDLYFYPEEQATLERVASFAESEYDRLSREFDFQIKEPTPLIFFATHSAFEQNNVLPGFVPESVGAFASPVHFRMVLPVDLPDEELLKLIGHELTHIFQYHILFGGHLSKALTQSPPTWLIEGMASYMGRDEEARDKMFLRDAVVNDNIPPITRVNFAGFYAYRFGHAVFDFIEDRWGKEGFRDFIYDYRNTLGGRVDKAIKHAFRMEPEDFDIEFRRWLRKKYLPELVRTGEPGDFGRRFRVGDEDAPAMNISPVASPSGDLVAAISTLRDDVDVVLFDARKRKVIRSLTKSPTNKYQYLVAQEFTMGRKMGRDLAFSPDGNQVAVFAKRDRGRDLLLLNVLHGGIDRIVPMPDVEQQIGPAWSPDGKRVAFSADRNGQFDIFEVDLESGKVTNVTNDEAYDGGPTYSPDGKSIVFSSVSADRTHLYRVDLADPTKRYAVTTGDSNDRDPVFSTNGSRLYYTRDLAGVENIVGLDLATGDIRQYTNVVTGCYMPTVLAEPEGGDRLVYSGFWNSRFDLYTIEAMDAAGAAEKTAVSTAPAGPAQLTKFEPDIKVTLDPANQEKVKGFKFFIEDAGAEVGVNSDQTIYADTYLSFSDYLGNRRITALFSSIASFSNFEFQYLDLSRRLQWQTRVFDYREFYVAQNAFNGRVSRLRAAYTETGAAGALIYPLDIYHRFGAELAGIARNIDFQSFEANINGETVPVILPRKDTFPQLSLSLVGDSAIFSENGPIAGRRWRIEGSYAPDLGKKDALPDITPGSTLTSSILFDGRQYVRVTRRSNLALRLFAGASFGNAPTPFYFGGLDTLRGFDFRDFSGDRAAFANIEYRFPLIDYLGNQVLKFQGIRGRFFFDVGAAYYSYSPLNFKFYDSKTSTFVDGRAAYGWGLTVNFLGLDLNWDFARPYRSPSDKKGFRTAFWIGTQF